MIGGLKPYPEYKDSGVPWLGEIPATWNVRRMKLLLREVESRSSTGAEQLLRVSQYTGVTERKVDDGSSTPDTRASSLTGYKRVAVGDLVVNIMLAWNGSMGASRYAGIVSPAYCVYRFSGAARPWYYHELLRTPSYKGRIKAASTGVVESRLRLYSDDLGRIEALQPPTEDQDAIVRFLDWANGRLARAIRAKRKLIALLNEQKQAIIHRAVTRGLDPNAPKKPSGITGLGEIPVHWKVSRLKFETTNIVDCLHATPHYSPDGEYPAVRTADIEPGGLRLSQMKKVSSHEFELWTSRLAPKGGDILYSREGERYGIAALVPAEIQLCISQRMMVFRVKSTECSEFIMWQLNCPHVYAQAAADIIGAAAPHVNVGSIRNYRLALPPVSEQRAISNHIRVNCVGLEVAITRFEREIGLLREYRTRLVADVVTGKLDVRGIEVPSHETIEDAGPLMDAEEVEADEEELVEEAANAD